MKKLYLTLLASIAFGFFTPLFATNVSDCLMEFNNTYGTFVTLSAEDLEMTFADGNLIAKNNEEQAIIPLSELKSFCFSFRIMGVELTEDLTTDINIISISGARMGHFNSIEEARQSLPAGIYVIEKGNSHHKIVIK